MVQRHYVHHDVTYWRSTPHAIAITATLAHLIFRESDGYNLVQEFVRTRDVSLLSNTEEEPFDWASYLMEGIEFPTYSDTDSEVRTVLPYRLVVVLRGVFQSIAVVRRIRGGSAQR